MSSSRIAARLRRIKPSPSGAAADRARELLRQGRKLVNLVVGEPDFDTPAHIRRAACEAIERGETRYTQTAGTPALREAIAEKLRRENGVAYEPRQITVTSGAKQAIFNALAATLEPGDEVLIPAPYWVSYPDMAIASDGVPVVIPCREEDHFKLTAAALEAAITKRSRWLILNSPTNPTGAAYSRSELRALADVLLRHPNLWLLTDDIYEHIRFTSGDNPHPVAIEPELRARTILVNGVSKTYAMTGWRIGYAAGPDDLIEAMNTLQSQTTSCACSVSQAAALAALRGPQSFVAETAQIYRERRDRGLTLLNEIPGISCTTPGGAFYLFANCGGLIGRRTQAGKRLESDSDVVMYLLDEAGVALVAGSAYGISPYFRMSIAAGIDVITEGCRRIAVAAAALSREPELVRPPQS